MILHIPPWSKTVTLQFLFDTDLFGDETNLRIFSAKKAGDVVAMRHLKEICMECDALEIACGISSHLVMKFFFLLISLAENRSFC